jgi:hypothetical protein
MPKPLRILSRAWKQLSFRCTGMDSVRCTEVSGDSYLIYFTALGKYFG